nr:retrovirus-related Pol polyprotein from transposon TNT 1-94 [Tanacetum cinerariifolium]
MTNNINHFKQIVDDAWVKHSKDLFRAPTVHDMEILIQTCLMPLGIKTQGDSLKFVHELKQEMHADLKYVESLEKEIDELESEKAEFLEMYDVILQDCVSKDVMCSYLQSLSNLDALAELQCMYLHKVKECDCLAQKLSKQTESVSKKVHTELLQRFSKVEKHSISLEIALQNCKELRIPKPSVLGKPTPFSDSLERRYFPKTKSVVKTNVSEVDSNHFACVTKMLNDVHAGTKKPAVVPISTRKPKSQANNSTTTPHKKSNHGSDLYMISLQESTSSTPLCLMAKATPTQAWLWHQRLSHLNFDYINLLSKKDIVIGLPKLKYVKDQLCSSYELSKAKRSSFKSKAVLSSKGRLNLLQMDLCGPMRVASINGKKYILVIVDDYSRYTWTLFLRSKDETPEVLKDFLTMIQRNLQAPMIIVRTDRGTKDGENLDKMKEKGDQCILVGYSTQLKGYQVYNKRTRMIVESIHIRFDEIKEVLEPSDYDNPDPVPQRQDVSSLVDADVPSQQELDLLFGPLYDEFFNAGSNPSTNVQSTSAPITHTNVHAEDNNNDQAEEGEQLQDDEFTHPFCALAQEEAESSSHNIDKGQSISTPMAMKPKLDADLSGNPVDQTEYHSKIGSLMYLTSSRPDIVQAGSRFELTAFSDADHAGCIDSRKSTSRRIQFLGDKLVSWMSKKQNCTGMSSADDEYVALSASCAQIMWMRTQLQDYGFNTTKYHCIVTLSQPYQFHATPYNTPVPNTSIHDMFTKALPEDRFKYLVRQIGMRCLTPAELEVLAKEFA